MLIALVIGEMKKHLFKCTMLMGHRGAGRGGEKVFYLRAADSLEAMRKVKGYRGVKKGRRYYGGSALLSLEMVA